MDVRGYFEITINATMHPSEILNSFLFLLTITLGGGLSINIMVRRYTHLFSGGTWLNMLTASQKYRKISTTCKCNQR